LLTTWGDDFYIGLNGIEFFDDSTQHINILPESKIMFEFDTKFTTKAVFYIMLCKSTFLNKKFRKKSFYAAKFVMFQDWLHLQKVQILQTIPELVINCWTGKTTRILLIIVG